MRTRGALGLVHAETGRQGLVDANERGAGARARGKGALGARRCEREGRWGSCSRKRGTRCSSMRTRWTLGLVLAETGRRVFVKKDGVGAGARLRGNGAFEALVHATAAQCWWVRTWALALVFGSRDEGGRAQSALMRCDS